MQISRGPRGCTPTGGGDSDAGLWLRRKGGRRVAQPYANGDPVLNQSWGLVVASETSNRDVCRDTLASNLELKDRHH